MSRTTVSPDMVDDGLKKRSKTITLNQPIASTIPLLLDAEYAFTIKSVVVKTSSGSITYSLTVEGGAAHANYTSKVIDTDKDIYTADQAVALGESVELVLASPSSPGFVTIQINWEAD